MAHKTKGILLSPLQRLSDQIKCALFSIHCFLRVDPDSVSKYSTFDACSQARVAFSFLLAPLGRLLKPQVQFMQCDSLTPILQTKCRFRDLLSQDLDLRSGFSLLAHGECPRTVQAAGSLGLRGAPGARGRGWRPAEAAAKGSGEVPDPDHPAAPWPGLKGAGRPVLAAGRAGRGFISMGPR